ncbi:hypothetical protein [Chryseobacterium indologenes]|uniref:Uncharacterized protein n=1 Tax=Chryseobacterium indologenes TaxID=253 RepID=A0A0N0IWT2_CHRID|nr:hypothetical protein [Chryseobacterium indologenes]KPE51663.1 hypothetical protein AOB46_08400 [Chryseobacterium indologenes]
MAQAKLRQHVYHFLKNKHENELNSHSGSQRQFLSELNKDLSIDEELICHPLYQIDLEEERIRMI